MPLRDFKVWWKKSETESFLRKGSRTCIRCVRISSSDMSRLICRIRREDRRAEKRGFRLHTAGATGSSPVLPIIGANIGFAFFHFLNDKGLSHRNLICFFVRTEVP